MTSTFDGIDDSVVQENMVTHVPLDFEFKCILKNWTLNGSELSV